MKTIATSALAALLLAPLPAGAGPDKVLGPTQRIKAWGYSIRIVENWNAITPEPDERHVVGRWKPDLRNAQKRGDYQAYSDGQFCSLSIIRIVPKKSETRTAEGPEGSTPDPAARVAARLGGGRTQEAPNLRQWIENVYPGAGARMTIKPAKAGPLSGSLMDFTSGQVHVLVGSFENDGLEWGIVYEAHEETFNRDWAKVYTQSIQSLRFFPPEGKPDSVSANADITKLSGEDRRQAIKARIAGLPGWYAVDSPNYVFLSNSTDKTYVNQLSKELETIRSRTYETLFPALKTIDTICIVRVLSTQDEYHQYGGPPGSAGYWNSQQEELVLFTEFSNLPKRMSRAYCKSVMYHEGFHQYIHYACGDFAPHSWFNEGHGDYFAGSSVGTSSVTIRPFSWRVETLKEHLIQKRDLIPTKSLVRLPQSEYYSNAGLKYAQGWALVYFLRNVTKNRRYQEINEIYFQHLRDNITALKAEEEGVGGESVPGIPGVSRRRFTDAEKAEKILAEAVDKAFDGIDMEAFDKEFHAWIRTL